MDEPESDVVNMRIDSLLGTDVSLLCAPENVGTLACLLATWAGLIMRLAEQDTVVLGQPYSVQLEHAELRDLV